MIFVSIPLNTPNFNYPYLCQSVQSVANIFSNTPKTSKNQPNLNSPLSVTIRAICGKTSSQIRPNTKKTTPKTQSPLSVQISSICGKPIFQIIHIILLSIQPVASPFLLPKPTIHPVSQSMYSYYILILSTPYLANCRLWSIFALEIID